MQHIFLRLLSSVIFVLTPATGVSAEDMTIPDSDELTLMQIAVIEATAGSDQEKFRQIYHFYQQSAENMQSDAPIYAEAAYRLGKKIYGENDKNTARLAYNYGYALLKAHSAKDAYPALKFAQQKYDLAFGQDSAEHIPLFRDLCMVPEGKTMRSAEHGVYCWKAMTLSEKYDGLGSPGHIEMLQTCGYKFLYVEDHLYNSAQENVENKPLPVLPYFALGVRDLGRKLYTQATEHFEAALRKLEEYGPAAYYYQAIVHAYLALTLETIGERETAMQHRLAIGKLRPPAGNEDYMPIFKARPTYFLGVPIPDIKHTVVVKFTILANGRVENPVIVKTDPKTTVYNLSALQAVQKFRYTPRYVNGEPVDTKGVKETIVFKSGV